MKDLITQIEELTLRCDSSTLLPVILQVEQLIKERDEARREICEISSQDCGELDLYASNKEAKRRDWDCFDTKKEEAP
jgi:hypothetical protein